MRKFGIIILIVLSTGLTACSGLFFFPSKDKFSDPHDYGFEYESLTVPSLDGTKLRAWFFPTKASTPKGLILQLHGNAENISSHYMGLAWVVKEGFDFLTFDYRGYGESEGEKDIDKIHYDVHAMLRFSYGLAREKKLPIILYGQSLGGTMLLKCLEVEPPPKSVKLVVIESSFYSYRQIAREKMNKIWITWPFQWLSAVLFSNQYSPGGDNLKKISPTPIVLIHSENDPVVPYHHSVQLFSDMAEPKEMWSHKSTGHIDGMFVESRKYRAQLLKKIDRLLN